MPRGRENDRVDEGDPVTPECRECVPQNRQMVACKALVIQQLSEFAGGFILRNLVELGQDEYALRGHAFWQIRFLFSGLHLGHNLPGALEMLLMIGEQISQHNIVSITWIVIGRRRPRRAFPGFFNRHIIFRIALKAARNVLDGFNPDAVGVADQSHGVQPEPLAHALR